jgi:glutamate-1-semialdehyde aminotransferase
MTVTKSGPSLYRRAKKLIPGGTQLLSKRPEMYLPERWPSYFSRAHGACVWDLDGNRYIDMTNNSVGTCPLGYADPEVNSAVKSVVDEGNISTLNCQEEVELAELLCELHPWAGMARFTRSGCESMSVAVRIARALTGRSKVAFCGYHGWSDWYLAANIAEPDSLGTKGLLLPGLDPAGVPTELAGTALTFRHNNIDELEHVAAEHGDSLAAIVCEVMRLRQPEPGFLEGARRIASETGAVLIFDEISSGFRMNPGGVHLLFSVTPDVAVFSKALGNGYPIGAVIGTSDVMQAAQNTFISSTYWTERIGPSAAIAMIGKYRNVKANERMILAGNRVQEIWRSEAGKAGLDVTVDSADMPPMSHIRFNYENARAIQTLLCRLMLDRGVLDNGAFYSTFAHNEDVLSEYENAAGAVFPEIAAAVDSGTVEERLGGPVGHAGFQRLTS